MAQVWTFPCQPMAIAAGVGVSTSGTLAASGISPLPQPPFQLIANGARLRMRATLEITASSAVPTFTCGFYITAAGGGLGQVISGKVAIAVSGALPVSASAVAWPVIMEYDGTLRTLSPSAAVINGQGTVTNWAAVGLSGAGAINPMPITAALRTVSTLDTSQVNELDVGINTSATTISSALVTNFWAELSG